MTPQFDRNRCHITLLIQLLSLVVWTLKQILIIFMSVNKTTMTVLYAEDDFDDFNMLVEVVQSINPDIQCVNARNGVEAIEFLENADLLPDYIFLDINMPMMDGKACLKFIKKDERFKNIPVIVFTTSNSVKDMELCKELGAEEYLQKPNTIQKTTEILSKIFAAK
jgi:CheY-like chemotaxis protein